MKNGQEKIKIIDNKILIGKFNPEKDDFGTLLLFARRDIEQITIHSYITKISGHAFEHCRKLKKVEISEDSRLQFIGKFAFYDTSIQEISLPSSILEMGIGWCCGIISLNKLNLIQKNEKKIEIN